MPNKTPMSEERRRKIGEGVRRAAAERRAKNGNGHPALHETFGVRHKSPELSARQIGALAVVQEMVDEGWDIYVTDERMIGASIMTRFEVTKL